jgi:hypothetical protein
VIARQRLARGAEVVEQFDTALRRAARERRGPVVGEINVSRRQLTIDPSADRSKAFTLPDRVTVKDVRIGSRRTNSPENRIVASHDGSSQSYALRLSIGDATRWVLLVGGTGQVVHDLESASVNSVLAVR